MKKEVFMRPELTKPEGCHSKVSLTVTHHAWSDHRVCAAMVCKGWYDGEVVVLKDEVVADKMLTQDSLNQAAESANQTIDILCGRCVLNPVNRTPDDLSDSGLQAPPQQTGGPGE